MQQTVALSELKQRVEAINLTVPRVARRAKVDPATAYRAIERDDCRKSIENKLTQELLAEELRLLRHLISLHGVPDSGAPA